MTNGGPPHAHRPVLRLLGAFVAVSAAAGVLSAGLVMPAVGATGAVAREGVDVFEELPADVGDDTLSEATTILWADGSVMATVYDQNRVVVPLEAIAPVMRDAMIAIEDSRFYDHGPIDLRGIGRALVNNATSDSGTQGASTLTQQLVKNILVEQAVAAGDQEAALAAITAEGTAGYARKLREMKMAIGLEKEMSKDEILAGYLNISYFFNNVYGVEAASRFYFNGKSARDLTLPEAALLAGIVRDPSGYDPIKKPEAATQRRAVVLKRMLDLGYIDDAAYAGANAAPLGVVPLKSQQGCMSAGSAAYFCDYVRHVIVNDAAFGATPEDRENLLKRGGLTIRTTLDRRVQDIAKAAVDAGVRPGQSVRAAESVVEPRTGKILAMAQNTTWSPDTDQVGVTTLNYNADAAHGGGNGFPTGSTFKPFTLTEWLKSGRSLDSVVAAPASGNDPFRAFTSCGQKLAGKNYPYSNSEGSGPGRMTVRAATANSVNTAYMSMEKQLDLCNIAKTAQSLGVFKAKAANHNGDSSQPVTTDLDTNLPSLTLGVQEIAPLAMAGAYAAFAAEGLFCKPVAITEILDTNGQPLPVPSADCQQVMDPNVARNVNTALQGTWNNGTAARVKRIGRPVAGKTGTTNNSTNVWFCGYTPQMAAAVWVGHADANNKSLNSERINGRGRQRIYGATIPAPIWSNTVGPASTALGLPVQSFTPGSQAGLRTVNPDGASRVPSVVGRSVSSARAALVAAGFEVVIASRRVASDSVRAGNVAQQSPGGGRSADPGDTITLYRSSGPAPKPTPTATQAPAPTEQAPAPAPAPEQPAPAATPA
ncbi:penicillin-binding protein, partial [Kineococcus glutinatus]|uniref:penicillin-binding protein n=1 Tax=Kineococcus glutinatus TaxID=1070872 RepID=UPI0031E7D947